MSTPPDQLAPRPFGLCHYTMIELDPPAFVDVAARAGFTAVSLMVQFPASRGPGFPVLGDTAMRRETRQRLDDTGLMLFDAAACRLEPDTGAVDFEQALETAAYLGARTVNVNGNDPDPGRLRDRFAALCARADGYGLRIGLEFMMSTQVKTLDDALALITRAGAANAAVTVDALHLARSGGSPADVAALDAAQVSYVQLCDGPARVPPEGYAWEGATERMLPGAGELPLSALVEAVAPGVLLAVEAPSRRRVDAGIGAGDYAARAMDSLRCLLGESR
ncbi:MAG TPA: TIM barrel protein [Trebonia sp.]|nr:TIM barrel protein [Trebonia sp.]